jgi:hypothetical protein
MDSDMNQYFNAVPVPDAVNNTEDAAYWIIGSGGSDTDDVDTYLVFGTREQVKKHLVAVIQSDIESNKEDFEYGTTSVHELQSFNLGRKFYGSAVYSNSHADYTATMITDKAAILLN